MLFQCCLDNIVVLFYLFFKYIIVYIRNGSRSKKLRLGSKKHMVL